jgi:hypothetical protein
MCLVDENDKVQGKKKGSRWNEEQIFYVYMYLVCCMPSEITLPRLVI